jgi:hypothetical protein
MKQTYRALTCFLIDFWDHQECEPHTNPATVQELQVSGFWVRVEGGWV